MIIEEMKAAMYQAGFTVEDIRKAVHCMDSVMINYNISKKEANIALKDDFNANMRYLKIYFDCRMVDGLAKGTLNNRKYYLVKFINELNCSVLDVTSIQIRQFIMMYYSQCSNSTKDKIKSYISAFYEWLIKERQTTYNPCCAIPKIRTAFKYQGCLSNEELKHIKFACKNKRELLLVEFFVSSGCRIEEFTNIKLMDINLVDKYVIVNGKGNKERKLYFSAEAKILIEKLYGSNLKQKNGYLYGSKRKGVLNGLKLCTNMVRNDLRKIVNRVKDRIQLKKVTPHTFRRTFATILINKGVKLEIVSKLLGHSSITTTMRYIFISEDSVQDNYSKFVA